VDQGGAGVGGAGLGVAGIGFFPGFEAADPATNSSNATEGIVIDDAGAGAFFVPVPWNSDAGVVGDGLPFSFPSPTSLPSASATSEALALAGAAGTELGANGCGEPPSCYLRTIIATAQGRVYLARLSKSYPKDSCTTKTIDCDGAVLVGDSNARFADTSCGASTPQITLGFLVPQALLFSWQPGQLWESTSGFRSEWTLIDAGDDSGTYEPMPGRTSKLWPAWTRFLVLGVRPAPPTSPMAFPFELRCSKPRRRGSGRAVRLPRGGVVSSSGLADRQFLCLQFGRQGSM
jgi:hypothetical protein